MPTQPALELLPEATDNPHVARVLRTFSDGIRETFSFGTHVLKWCAEAGRGGDETSELWLLFRHALELLDSIAILVRQSSVEPCKALLRCLLEVLYFAEYILRADTTRRAKCLLVWDIRNTLNHYECMAPTTQRGKQLRQIVGKGRYGKRVVLREPPELQERIRNLQILLAKPEYAEVDAEYERLRAARMRNPAWYALFGGPTKVESLAAKVGLSDTYEILYRHWSGTVHATDVRKGKISSSGGRAAIHQIRLPTAAQEVTFYSLSLAFPLYRAFIRHYVPLRQVDYSDWYKAEVRDLYLRLAGPQIIAVD